MNVFPAGVRTGGRLLLVALVLLVGIRLASPPAEAQRGGPLPQSGEAGITESVATIMARQARIGVQSARVTKPVLRATTSRAANPASTNVPTPPPADPPAPPTEDGRDIGPRLPQTTSNSFTGASFTTDNLNLFPPDSMGAVGPTQFIVAINGRFRSFNKATGAADGALDVDDTVFFNSVRNGNSTSDPRIRYDRQTGRWFIVMISVALDNRILLAVSNGGTITSQSNFTFFFINVATLTPPINSTDPCIADYPTLGIDANALYIGTNNFCGTDINTAPFHSTDGYVVRKSSITGAGPIVTTVFRGLIASFNADGPFTPQGVDNFDTAATEGYFIGVSNQFFGRLLLRRVSNPGGTPTISADIPINVNDTRFPVLVPHLGNNSVNFGRLDALDDRLFAAVMRNGRLWTAHNIQVDGTGAASTTGGRNGVRWYELQNVAAPGTPTAAQQGTIFDPAATDPTFYWIGTVMVSGQGHMAAGFSQAGNLNRADAATNGRLAGDAAGTTRAVTPYTATTFNYNPPGDPGGAFGRRWGDYSYTSLDPEDDMTMWTIQEFTDQANSWGVRVVKLLAPPPVTPNIITPSSVAGGQSAVNVTLTGPATNGAGFYDPGTGFAKRIGVTVSGGVTVNSVTVNSPTSVTVSLRTVGTAAGQKNITITNPDGQAVTVTNAISVTGGGGGIPGDVNASGAVDIVDALCVARDVAGLPATAACPLPLVNPDVNSSGTEDIVDALCIARHVAGLPTTAACPNTLGQPLAPTAAADSGRGGSAVAAVRPAPATLSLDPASLSLPAGGQSSVTVRAAGAGRGAAPVGAWAVDLAYDAAVVRPVGCSPTSGGLCNLSYAPGVVRLAGTSVSGLVGDGALGSVQFAAVGAAGSSGAVTAHAVSLITTEGAPLSAPEVSGTVTIQSGRRGLR